MRIGTGKEPYGCYWMRFSSELATSLVLGPRKGRSRGRGVVARAGSGREILSAVSDGFADWHGGHGQLPMVYGTGNEPRTPSAGRRYGEDSGQRSSSAKARQAGCT